MFTIKSTLFAAVAPGGARYGAVHDIDSVSIVKRWQAGGTMHRCIRSFVGVGLAWFALGVGSSFAQTPGSRPPAAPPAALPEATTTCTTPPASGPTVYVVDSSGRLATINLGTKAVHVIGTTVAGMTDIGFDPKNHELYGVSFSGFYAIDKATAKAKYIGSLGVTDANALVFKSDGSAYSAGVNSGDLYKIGVANGRVGVVGSTGGYKSAGDLVYYNDMLVLSAFTGGSVGPTTPNYLVELNATTGKREGSPVLLPLKELFGLVSTGKNELYGFALLSTGTGAGLYQIFPGETTVAKRSVLLANLTSKGLGQIYGAAYDGNYQP